MPDEDKNRARDWGHHKSPIFKLPPEIRNKIYHETFAASERDLVIDPPMDIDIVPVTGRRSVFTTAKSTHHFLLTCFQVYCEALAIYWSSTLVRNGPSHDFPLGHFSRGYFLNRIPAIARQHIQHLRGVYLMRRLPDRWLQGQAIGLHLSPAESLDLFSNLKSCLLLDWGHECHSRSEVSVRHPNVHTFTKQVRKLRIGAAIPWLPGWNSPFRLKKVSRHGFQIVLINAGRRCCNG